MLWKLRPDAPQDRLDKLPGLAQRIDAVLFREAKSRAQYRDIATLLVRLREISHKAKRVKTNSHTLGKNIVFNI